MDAWTPYVLGALGGGGVLLVYYGLKAVRGATAPAARRRGLWMINLGVVLAMASLALTIWAR